MANRYYTVTWDQLHRDCKALGVAAGGERPLQRHRGDHPRRADSCSDHCRELDCRLIESVSIVTHDEEKKGEPKVMKPPAAAGDGEGWLILDDLVDTGTTGRVIRAMLPKAHFATVYAKPAGRPTVDTFVTEVSQDTWILFLGTPNRSSSPPSRNRPRQADRPAAGLGGGGRARAGLPPGGAGPKPTARRVPAAKQPGW